MSDRIPLIVNAGANQIQELPNQDDLVLSGKLKMEGTALGSSDILMSGGSDAKSVITIRGTASNLSQLNIACRNNADSADLPVAEFNVGASDKIEFISKGEITAVQPTCLLTIPKPYTANNTENQSNHIGGTNEKPISFINETTRVGCTTSLASDPAQGGTSGITSITVPSAGTYLISASISGENNSSNAGNQTNNKDQVRLCLSKTGISTFPSTETFPASVFGNEAGEEFNINFTLPLQLAANDSLSVHFSHVGDSTAAIQEGHFSVTKLH